MPAQPHHRASVSPRIWRSPKSNFYGDECRDAASIYDENELAGIHDHGFDAIWLRGRLYELMDSQVFPELNRAGAADRIGSLQTLIARAAKHGVSVYLYFSEPLALPANSQFWNDHPDLAGEHHHSAFEEFADMVALCTSAAQVRQFLLDAIHSVLKALPGLGGVILITASEYHSHCWSHRASISLNDGFVAAAEEPMTCPRCASRQPADVVLELIELWSNAAKQANAGCRIIAWNWSWSMWYPDPQAQIVSRLPQGVQLLIDWERGGQRPWMDQVLPIDEYSLSYVGPSGRFLGSMRAAADHTPVLAKLQLGTTHELATVPNLPLLANLHQKLVRLWAENISGFMACWNFGCERTLNSFAVALFVRDPKRYQDQSCFLADLAREYLGLDDSQGVQEAWRLFGQAFLYHPFTMRMVYNSPMNYAPAYPLSLEYRGVPMGASWVVHEPWGDRLDDCLDGLQLDQVIEAIGQMLALWERGLACCRASLSGEGIGSDEQRLHRQQEWSSAAMIGVHVRSFGNILKFHRWRIAQIRCRSLSAPCRLMLDDEATAIFRDESANVFQAIKLVSLDARLGYHQECHAYLYDRRRLEEKSRDLLRYIEDSHTLKS